MAEEQEQKGYQGGRDPPPLWDGSHPEKRWKEVRREILLWAADTDCPASKQGVRFYRRTPVGSVARDLIKGIKDEVLCSEDGLKAILAIYDKSYEGFMKVSESETFEKALYSGARKGEESFMVYTARKDREFIEFESLEDVELPDKLKGKIFLRQANLSPQQRQMVLTWTECQTTFLRS